MAEQDEENPRLNQEVELDLSDETQDFRFLNLFSKGEPASLPKRGEKDFEPDGTNKQDRVLEESRQAMRNALLGERKLQSKQTMIGTWRPHLKLAEVHVQRGIYLKNMGKADKKGVPWLLPEEVIYLVERGSMECWWENGIPMSVQSVYAACLKDAGGLEKYQVYSNLRRNGFAVFRAEESYEPAIGASDQGLGESASRDQHRFLEMPSPPFLSSKATPPWRIGIFSKLFDALSGANPYRPLLSRGAYRSYEEVYGALDVPPEPYAVKRSTDDTFHVDYFVYKPKPKFKKSDPGPPDFRVSVVSARDTSPPSLSQLETLFDTIPYIEDPPEKKRTVMQKLKEGERYVIVAIVDSGVISYMRFSDSSFHRNRLKIGNKQGNKSKRGPQQGKNSSTPKSA